MRRRLSRREFIKLAGIAGAAGLAGSLPDKISEPSFPPSSHEFYSAFHAGPSRYRDAAKPGFHPHVLIFLFDALSAFNLSVYGYPRRTSPNLERFAGQSTVYHFHHSAGNFTTPSTASLFTGVYPWNHRAFNLSGLARQGLVGHSLFDHLTGYHRLAFTQNIYTDMLLHQFGAGLDQHEAIDRFALVSSAIYPHLTPNDPIFGMKSLDQFLFKREEAHGSLFASIFNDLALQIRSQRQARAWAAIYPSGLPRLANTDVQFAFSQLTDGLIELTKSLVEPTFAYFHLMPPHAPYLPAHPYLGAFGRDGFVPQALKKHRLAAGVSQERLDSQRQLYDEFILNLDAEFGRLLAHLEQSGLLESSYIIFTSDHGEMFERGASGHSTPLLFEPGIRIPLMIHAPGQQERVDIQALTSNVDLLPTLLSISGEPVPAESEGRLLPGLGLPESSNEPDRRAFVIEAKANAAYQPLKKASTALLQGKLKLVHYQGYRHYRDEYELYELEEDPLEQNNRFDDHPDARDLRRVLDEAQANADKTYLS